jgi:hypothetical protein
MTTTATGEARSRPSVIAYVLGGLALAALLAMSILFVASGLLAPLWAVIGLMAAWAVLFVLGCVWIRWHPWRVLLLPLVAGAILFGGINAGAAYLGWSP